ncbi:TPA: flagellar motor switch protein FliG [Candidatus Poribacteria bacterium]|nr:flagellar motor switch protein FliG [Candidatus Poribacteria bacterium]
MNVKGGDVTGLRKIGIFLLTLKGPISGEVFKSLSEKEQEKVLVEIASPNPIAPEERSQVLDEFMHNLQSAGAYASGGMEEAQDLLQSAFGSLRAAETMTAKLESKLENKPFSMFNDADPAEIYQFLVAESPQTIALVLSNIVPDKAGEVLQRFQSRMRSQIAGKIATMEAMSPEAVQEVENVLVSRFKGSSGQAQKPTDGADILAKMLNKFGNKEDADGVIESMQQKHPEVANKIREGMFTFDDIVLIDKMEFRNEIVRLPSLSEHLATALKGAGEDVQSMFFDNMTEKQSSRLRSNLSEMGSIKASAVNEAQKAILEEVRELEESGKITISREEEEVFE